MSIKRCTLKDKSGTVAVASTAQTVAPANASRDYFFFQNLDASADMWLNFGTSATADTPSIRLGPGDSITFDTAVPVDLVSLICGTSGAKFTSKEA